MNNPQSDSGAPLVEPLTRREREVLALLAQGYSAPEIAEQLTLAVSSVKWHIQHVYEKLGVNTKRQALIRAKALGLLEVGAAATAPALAPPPVPSRDDPLPDDPQPPEEPPYKGLRYFDSGDAGLFFGREQLTARLVGQLRAHHFLAVVGASGSGKSSLLRAGLIPALASADPLADGHLPPEGSAHWLVHVLTPTAHPLEALAVSLTRDSESVTAATTLMDDLAADVRSLHVASRRLLNQHGGDRLLLIVDQFEELFTLCHDGAERKAFVDNLMAAVAAEGVLAGVIALRADFYAHCGQYPRLRAALERHQAFIGPMSADELRRATEEPARRGGWEWEPGLVDLLLSEAGAGQEPGALPLLSHALLETWKRRRGRTLTYAGYMDAGGVRGAIARTAQRVYEQLSPEQQAITRRVFLRLTEPGEGTRDTRRRANFSELLPGAEAAPDRRQMTEVVLRTLADARLITTTASTVEVAHEALLQEWPALREWLNDSREGLRLHRRLTQSAQAWQQAGRDPGELFRGARLAQAVEWAGWSAGAEELDTLEREFLAASSLEVEREAAEREAGRQRELEAARKLAEEQARSSRRLRLRNRVVTSVGLLAVALAAAAGFFGLQANQNALRAEREADLALARQLTLQADSLLASEYDVAALLSLEALRIADTVEARSMLRTVLESRPPEPEILRGHTGQVNDVAVSPDGKLVASAGTDHHIILWDVLTGDPIGQPLVGHTQAVNSVAFSPDGRLLASVGWDFQVILWDVATRQPLDQPLTIPSGPTVNSINVAFSPDGRTLAASVPDGSILLWDRATRQRKGLPLGGSVNFDFAGGESLIGNIENSGAIAFSPDSRTLAAISGSGTWGVVILWDLATRQPMTLPADDRATALSLDFSHDGTLIALGDIRGDIGLGSTATHTYLAHVRGLASATSVAFSPDDRVVAAGTVEGTITLWDVASREAIGPALDAHSGEVTGLAFTPDGQTLVSSSRDGSVILWDLAPDQSFDPPLVGHPDWVTSVAYSHDGKRLASASSDGTILLWDTATSEPIGDPISGPRLLSSLAFSPDGRQLAFGGGAGQLGLLDIETRQLVAAPFAGQGGDVTSLAFSPDGKVLASGSTDTTIHLWDSATGQPIGDPLAGHSGGITGLDFSPDGKTFVSASRDQRLIVWDIATRQPLGEPLTGHTSHVTSVAFSPDGRTLVSGGNDGGLRFWDVASRQALGSPLSGHIGPVLTLAVSPDGRLLASGGQDATVRLWDMATRQPLGRPFTKHGAAVNALAFSPDGATLASGSNDTTILLWDVSVQSWQARACANAGRNLSRAEWDRFVSDRPYHRTCEEWPEGE